MNATQAQSTPIIVIIWLYYIDSQYYGFIIIVSNFDNLTWRLLYYNKFW